MHLQELLRMLGGPELSRFSFYNLKPHEQAAFPELTPFPVPAVVDKTPEVDNAKFTAPFMLESHDLTIGAGATALVVYARTGENTGVKWTFPWDMKSKALACASASMTFNRIRETQVQYPRDMKLLETIDLVLSAIGFPHTSEPFPPKEPETNSEIRSEAA